MVHAILLGAILAILYALLNEANVSMGVKALTMSGAFVSALIYGILKDA